MIAGCDDDDSRAAFDEARFRRPHQHSPDPTPPMVRRDGQCHDLAIMRVVFVKRPAASSHETDHLPVLVGDQGVVVLVIENRFESPPHLTRCGRIAQVAYKSCHPIRVSDDRLSDRNTCHSTSRRVRRDAARDGQDAVENDQSRVSGDIHRGYRTCTARTWLTSAQVGFLRAQLPEAFEVRLQRLERRGRVPLVLDDVPLDPAH
jgi:hypothetical protein